MKKQHAYYTISFLLFFLFSVPLASSEPTYCIKDLGVIRDINDSFNSFGINRQGQVVGQVSFQYGGLLAGSLDFFSGRSHPGDFKTGAASIRELSQADVEDMLIFYQGEVFFPPVKSPTPWQKKPTEVLEDHFSHFTSFDINPYGLAFCDEPNAPYQKCHGLIPYAISWLSDAENKHAVFVYDSNYPDDTDLYIQFDPEVFLSEIRTVPLSAHKLYESGPLEGSVLNDVLIYLNEIGKLTITDTDGNSLGYIGDDFVSDIPGAYGSVIINGLDEPLPPLYTLPLDGEYTIHLDGSIVTEPGPANVTRIEPMCAAWVYDILVHSHAQDQAGLYDLVL